MDKIRFFNIAQGSLEECRYYLILTRDLSYGDVLRLQPLVEETSKLLQAYSGAIRRRAFVSLGAVLLGLAGLLLPLAQLWF